MKMNICKNLKYENKENINGLINPKTLGRSLQLK